MVGADGRPGCHPAGGEGLRDAQAFLVGSGDRSAAPGGSGGRPQHLRAAPTWGEGHHRRRPGREEQPARQARSSRHLRRGHHQPPVPVGRSDDPGISRVGQGGGAPVARRLLRDRKPIRTADQHSSEHVRSPVPAVVPRDRFGCVVVRVVRVGSRVQRRFRRPVPGPASDVQGRTGDLG